MMMMMMNEMISARVRLMVLYVLRSERVRVRDCECVPRTYVLRTNLRTYYLPARGAFVSSSFSETIVSSASALLERRGAKKSYLRLLEV